MSSELMVHKKGPLFTAEAAERLKVVCQNGGGGGGPALSQSYAQIVKEIPFPRGVLIHTFDLIYLADSFTQFRTQKNNFYVVQCVCFQRLWIDL